jgi:hypothetical protein
VSAFAVPSDLRIRLGPRPRDGPAGPHLQATIAGPAREAARLTRLCSLVAYGQSPGSTNGWDEVTDVHMEGEGEQRDTDAATQRKRPDAWAVSWDKLCLLILEFTRPDDRCELSLRLHDTTHLKRFGTLRVQCGTAGSGPPPAPLRRLQSSTETRSHRRCVACNSAGPPPTPPCDVSSPPPEPPPLYPTRPPLRRRRRCTVLRAFARRAAHSIAAVCI